MELPAYHWPTLGNVLRSMWERGWSFIKKAGTIILLSTIFVWFTTYFGWAETAFRMLSEERDRLLHPRHDRQRDRLDLRASRLGQLAGRRGLHHRPGGQGEHRRHAGHPLRRRRRHGLSELWRAAFTGITGYSFLVFNLLCAPCFAAIGAIKREMNNAKWTWFAIGYQCGFAYLCRPDGQPVRQGLHR